MFKFNPLTGELDQVAVSYLEFDDDTKMSFDIYNAVALDSPVVTVASDGATITLSMEKSGTGDVRFWFSDGVYTYDCTPAATVTLTAGTDAVPVENFIYVLQSDKTLTSSTAGFPATEHAPVATVVCESAATLQTDGAYKMHAWTDHVSASNSQGHLADINLWIRGQNATWLNGVVLGLTGSGTGSVTAETTSGTVLQLHKHAMPAVSAGHEKYVKNNSVAAYTSITDLNEILTDSTGGSMTNKYYSLVIWGVVSEDSVDSHLFINLPSGSYNTSATGIADAQKYTDFTVPTMFKGTAFMIARVTMRNQSDSTFTVSDTEDLRGQLPGGTLSGAGIATVTEFSDSQFRTFNNADNTKVIALDASAVATATTRTLTMADQDIDLANVPLATSLAGGLGGSIPYQSALNTTVMLANGALGEVFTSNGTTAAPSWEAAAAGVTDLQGAYDGGASITVAAGTPMVLTGGTNSLEITSVATTGIAMKLTIDSLTNGKGFQIYSNTSGDNGYLFDIWNDNLTGKQGLIQLRQDSNAKLINCDFCKNSTSDVISIQNMQSLINGLVMDFEMASQNVTTGGFFDFHDTTPLTNANKTGSFGILQSSRTYQAAGTRADDFDLLSLKRTNIVNGASSTLVTTGSVLKLENIGTDTSSTAFTDTVIPLEVVNNVLTDTNFIRIASFNGITIWTSDSTDPNGNLSGTAGDICFNGASNGISYCTGTTNWTAT